MRSALSEMPAGQVRLRARKKPPQGRAPEKTRVFLYIYSCCRAQPCHHIFLPYFLPAQFLVNEERAGIAVAVMTDEGRGIAGIGTP